MTIARKRSRPTGSGNPHIGKFRVSRPIYNRLVEEAQALGIPITELIRKTLEGTYQAPSVDMPRAIQFLNSQGFDVVLKPREG